MMIAAILFLVVVFVLSYKILNGSPKPKAIHHPKPIQANADWVGKTLDNPSLTSHKSDASLLRDCAADPHSEYITCYDPSTAQFIDLVKADSASDIESKIQLARSSQPEWSRSSWSRRHSVLNTLLNWLTSDIDNIVDVACRDTGKTRIDAAFGEILTTAEKIKWSVSNAESILSPQKRSTNWLLAHKISKIHYEPLGVTLASVSWNYPAHNSLSPIIASLITGNACIVKASEFVAWSSQWFVGAVKEALKVNGEDPNLVQLVICYPDVVETLTTSPAIDHITFIGSEPVGKKVASAASINLKPCCIELGGKDAAIVLQNADLSFFESTFMRATFQAAGQNCIGIERFIVHAAIYDDFVNRMSERIKALRLGTSFDPDHNVDVGAMITDSRFKQLEYLISDAVNRGARLLRGGKKFDHPKHPKGHYFEPTLLVDVTPEMEIFHEELFAPVMTVIKADTTDLAINIANNSRFGLGSAVFGNDKAECAVVAKELKCGMVSVNDFGVFYLNQSMPFGGLKASGYGRFGGEEGLRGICNAKAVIGDRFFSLIRTPIPAPLDYPVRSASASWQFIKGLLTLFYAEDLKDKVAGLNGLIKNS